MLAMILKTFREPLLRCLQSTLSNNACMSGDISLHCTPGLLFDPRHGRDGGVAGAGPQPLHPRLRPRDRDAAVRHAQRGLPQRRDFRFQIYRTLISREKFFLAIFFTSSDTKPL